MRRIGEKRGENDVDTVFTKFSKNKMLKRTKLMTTCNSRSLDSYGPSSEKACW